MKRRWIRTLTACVAVGCVGGAWLLRPAPAPAPPQAVWVLLDHTALALDLPPAIGPDALALRAPLDSDHPIRPEAVDRLARTGARVLYASRWLRAVAVDTDAATLARIAALPGVTGLARLRPLHAAGVAGGSSTSVSAPAEAARFCAAQDSAGYGPSFPALRELNIPALHALGFTGTGIRIAILDTGFNTGHEALIGRTVVRQRDFVNNDAVVANEPGEQTEPDPERHGTLVWSLLGGCAPGRVVGGAYDASFYLAKVDIAGADTRSDEARWVAAVEWADSLGVRLINSSIGYRNQFVDRPQIPYGDLDGNTTLTTRMADEAARRGMLLVVAIGNGGPGEGTLWAPADADSVLAVGAAEPMVGRTASATSLSSRGPTADGRLKPDVVARGVGLTGATGGGPREYASGLEGSSFATPLITAGAALFVEAWPDLTIFAVREALRLAASDARSPNNAVGYGLPNVGAAVMFPQGLTGAVATRDLQGNFTSITPAFTWLAPQIHARFRPIRYRVEIATDSLFTNIVHSDTITESFVLTVRQPIRRLERAYWRVTATFGSVQRITTPASPLRMPGWVRLLTLPGPTSEHIDDPRPELAWAPLAAPAPIGPFVYDVQVLSAGGEIVQQVRGLGTSSVRVPEALAPNQPYRWRVIARTTTGVADTVESSAPFVYVSTAAPPATLLYPNFPNPFPSFAAGSSGTRVWFDLAVTATVELAVYDTRGRLVRRLIPSEPGCGPQEMAAGLYGRGLIEEACRLFHWDGSDHEGRRAARGVYVLRLRAGGVEQVRRMLYLPD